MELFPSAAQENGKAQSNSSIVPHPTRGLGILSRCYGHVRDKLEGEGIESELHVYSSFEIYGPSFAASESHWMPLYDSLMEERCVHYHGFVQNDEIRRVLPCCDIFAYPSIYQETSCLCLMEAMSAGCLCVHPDYGALPETAGGWTEMYPYDEREERHEETFAYRLFEAARTCRHATVTEWLTDQSLHAKRMFDIDHRVKQWKELAFDV